MNITIEKKSTAVIDTSRERTRIAKAFKNDPKTREMLNALMDAVEAGRWKDALNQLEGKWWSGRDERQECPRLEFIGMLWDGSDVPPLFSGSTSYIDLILALNDRPENYKVVHTK